jgi:hypothetical protein
LDQAALTASQQGQGAAGYKSIAGGGGQSTQAQKAAAIGIGGAGAGAAPSGVMPGAAMAANIGAGGTGQPANVFKLPSASNLTFGGS